MAKVGVVTFMSLIEKYPEVQDIFIPFKGKTHLRDHGVKVIQGVGKVITRLDEPQKIETMLYELGANHTKFTLRADYFNLICSHIIQVIKPAIKDDWTIKMDEAWSDLFKMITSLMKDASFVNL